MTKTLLDQVKIPVIVTENNQNKPELRLHCVGQSLK